MFDANHGDSSCARESLHSLCVDYWKPVYAFIRSRGHDPDDSADLTQEFFSRILEKGKLGNPDPSNGRFRSYLLGAVKHFLADQHDKKTAQKRGGGLHSISLAAISAEEAIYRQMAVEGPDSVFDRKWAVSILERALVHLEERQAGERRAEMFKLLKPFLTGDTPKKSYAEISSKLGLKEVSIRSAVHRLRKDYGELVKCEIRQTLLHEDDVTRELKYLQSVLGS